MIEISEALPNELNCVQEIARRTWPVAYRAILSNEQLNYMLNLFYSLEALNSNIQQGHQFLLARSSSEIAGFAGFQIGYENQLNTHLHKIYVLPEMQGKHIGLDLLKSVEKLAKEAGQKTLSLNVNRNNIAISFYEKVGFSIIKTVDIEIGNGYLMEDYVMMKVIA